MDRKQTLLVWRDCRRGMAHHVEGLQSEAQLAVVDGVILGRVVDVRHLADVKLLLLVAVESLEQLPPMLAPQQHQKRTEHVGRTIVQPRAGRLSWVTGRNRGGTHKHNVRHNYKRPAQS